MSVLVRIGRKKAFLCEAIWRCSDIELEQKLQEALEIWIHRTGGPPMSNKDPDSFAAAALADEMGFEVTHVTPPKGRKARIAYVSKRQIRLPFY
jgi:hypothetical protein